MVQSVNSSNIPTDINPVGGAKLNAFKVTENQEAQFENAVKELQKNFVNDAKTLKTSRTIRGFGDIFSVNVKGKGFFGGIAQILTNISLYRQDPEKLMHNMEKYTDELSKKIEMEYRCGKEFSKSSMDTVLKFVRQAQVQIYEFKQRGQPNVPPEYDDRSPKEKEEDADIAAYGKRLEQLIQPNRLFKDLAKSIQTLTQSVIDRCNASDGLSSKDIQNLSSEIQIFEHNIRNLQEIFQKSLPVTKQAPDTPKAIQDFLSGLLCEDVFLLKDFSETLIHACTLSGNLNDQNFKEVFGNIEKLKSEFTSKGKFGGCLLKYPNDVANPAAHALKEAAFKSIDQSIKKFIGIEDFIAKTKAEIKEYDRYENYDDKELENTFDFRQKCCDFNKSDHIQALRTFAEKQPIDPSLKDMQETIKEGLEKLYKLTQFPYGH